jgi:hypothetical protein
MELEQSGWTNFVAACDFSSSSIICRIFSTFKKLADLGSALWGAHCGGHMLKDPLSIYLLLIRRRAWKARL